MRVRGNSRGYAGRLTPAWALSCLLFFLLLLPLAASFAGAVPGIDKVVEMLTRRLDFDALFDGGRGAAEQIARWSGGVLRDALFLAHQAVLTVDVPKVTDAGLERTFDDFVVARSRMLSETWGAHFRSIAANNRFPESCDGTTRFEMLRGAHVLEYRNGDPEPYYVVHPAVERCALFHSPPSTQ